MQNSFAYETHVSSPSTQLTVSPFIIIIIKSRQQPEQRDSVPFTRVTRQETTRTVRKWTANERKKKKLCRGDERKGQRVGNNDNYSHLQNETAFIECKEFSLIKWCHNIAQKSSEGVSEKEKEEATRRKKIVKSDLLIDYVNEMHFN